MKIIFKFVEQEQRGELLQLFRGGKQRQRKRSKSLKCLSFGLLLSPFMAGDRWLDEVVLKYCEELGPGDGCRALLRICQKLLFPTVVKMA
ncbi:hypothetical protein EFA69_13620 [Rufibacter immobilis]|uniref:Uncharacterized protein n=1 Tax=Rufibacter immobilis TaxID=1348778 RepID=A0A3M9MNU9_9BACT|nr:hypothetical protein EFA69_13620 [Rufibacter immobilis]